MSDQGESHSHDHDHEAGQDHDHGEDHSHDHDHGEDHAHDHEAGHDHAHSHHHDAEDLGVAVVTISTSRTVENDPSGDTIVAAVEDAGHEVATRELIGDDFDRIQDMVDNVVERRDVDLVVTTGGTGVTPDDVTPEAVEPLFEKDLPGFGELFRRLSYEEVGTATMLSRATGGIVHGVPVFCLPGSESAVRLGIDEVVLPEAAHLVGLAARDDEDDEE